MSVITEETINLLYIEDDESLYSLIRAFLDKSKHTTFNIIPKNTLESGLDHLNRYCNLIDESEVDAVLLDLVLPNSRGVNTFKRVKAICPDLPIIIISGYEDIACECVKLGAQDYLVKPDITPGILIRSIKYAIERCKLEKDYKESEQKYRKLVEATGAGIYELDFINMKVTYVNDVICEYTGYTREEFLQKSPFDFLTEASLKKFLERLEALKHGDFIEDATVYEMIKKDGSLLWAMINAQYKEDFQGNIVGASVVAIDITNQMLAEKALKKKEEEVYTSLENRIHKWKEEIIKRNQEKAETLNLINGKILSMSNSDTEVAF